MNGKYFAGLDAKHEAQMEEAERTAAQCEADVEDFMLGIEVDTIDTDDVLERFAERADLHFLIVMAATGVSGPLDRAYRNIATEMWGGKWR